MHLLKGNPSKKPIAQLLGEFKPEVEIPDCPKVLWPDARREWNRLVQELHRYGLISLLDRGMLAMGCQEYARWVWAEKKILAANRSDESGEAGLIEKAPSGYRMQSVYLQISVKSQERYEKAVAAFGLAPSARSRVTPSDNYPFLPGMEPGDDKGGEKEAPPAKPTLASLVR
ncbi:MAG TPA: P27 family phage terminase small subunit [Burkholderiales bacterium]|nr:P27 family phage terminase small subunit [Burkholderiales bacterium]